MTRVIRVLALAAFGCLVPLGSAPAQEWIDTVSEGLRFQSSGGGVRGRVSGTLDAEVYYVEQPPPGLITTDNDVLFNPRLSLFLDFQLGSQVYAFAQMRADRGFDPADHDAEVRLDEYALAVKPWKGVPLRLQAGRFATVFGNWVQRYDTWANPFITGPVPYENVTAVYDGEIPDSREVFLEGKDNAAGNYDKVPIIWGACYTSGAALIGSWGRWDYAVEFKNASLSSRPEVWDGTAQDWSHPTWNGRVGWRPNAMWNLGLSGSVGSYLRGDMTLVRDQGGEAEEYGLGSAHRRALPRGRGWGDYKQYVVAQDVSFAWHHWQVWAEVFAARFEVPHVGNADTLAYYIEAKYKLTPQWFAALRWNQQVYAEMEDGYGGREKWGNDLWRVDAALTWRVTTHQQFKVQYSLIDPTLPRHELQQFGAAQWTVRF